MFGRKRGVTVIADGLKIEGNVFAEGGVELNGLIEGELHCKSLRISRKGKVLGKVEAQVIFIDGTVDGPVHGTHVTLEPNAHVTGDVFHDSFAVEKGAFFDGRSRQRGKEAKAADGKPAKDAPRKFTATRLQNGADGKANEPGADAGPEGGKTPDKAPATS